jgi:nitrogen fixation protein FixH
MTTESTRARRKLTRWSRRIGVSALVLVVLAVAGCSRKNPVPPTAPSDDAASGWTLVLTVAPDHPRMVRPATLLLRITDNSGKPIENARLTASLNITLMDMGKTELKFEPKDNGEYVAAVRSFDMSGPWELTVDAARGRMHAHKVFPVTVFD